MPNLFLNKKNMKKSIKIMVTATIVAIICQYIFLLSLESNSPFIVYLFPGLIFALIFDTTNMAITYIYNILAFNMLFLGIYYFYTYITSMLHKVSDK